ncbi:hypothetical protein [Candidatus Poriferisocius sp.]|uniref:hypothetical protein n=1 Tax=Candidatus Poriferisocius sp. TaxID=3101276 RepID=UPI003B52B24B
MLIRDLKVGDILGLGGSNNVVQAIEPEGNDHYVVTFNEHNVQHWAGSGSKVAVKRHLD